MKKASEITAMKCEVLTGRITRILLTQPKVTNELKQLVYELILRFNCESDEDDELKKQIYDD
jgi:hypothetical protein